MPKKFSQKQLIIIGGGIAIVIIFVALIFFGTRPKVNSGPATKISMWGTEDQDVFGGMVASYPYGSVTYTHIDPANYQTQLLSALAAGTGPDVFEINNRDLPKWKSVLAPLPAAFAQSFNTLQLANTFPDVVGQDFVSDGQIYGLPLSIDTLAMIYNKDLFNSAGIAIPPKTWDDFDADIAQLRTVNDQGQIQRAAAAIGGSGASIPNAADLVFLLMLQNGTQMTDSKFTSPQFAAGDNGAPGPTAFNFYLQFGNAASPYYTWNDALGNSLTSFVNGKTAAIFGYQADLADIKAKAPFLNIGVAAMPQAKGASVAVNYPRYNGFVAAKAGQSVAAWNFILYLTDTSGDGATYVTKTGHPPALKTDIQADENDPNLSVFALQALTAKSWYEADAAQIDSIMNGAIQGFLSGSVDSMKALTEAQTAVNGIMNIRR